MGFHLPSFLVGSSIAGCGFLLIHRELSHRHRLTTKWALQEYAEKEWKEWRKSSLDTISEATKVSYLYLIDTSPLLAAVCISCGQTLTCQNIIISYPAVNDC